MSEIGGPMTAGDLDSLWDVAIIGAGPAGSLLSLILARGGRRVLLLDQAKFPRRKVCGGCFNGNAMTALIACGLGHLPTRLGAQPVAKVRLHQGKCWADLPFENNWSLSRTCFDAALIQEACSANVTFRSGQRATLGQSREGYRTLDVQSSDASVAVNAKIVVLAHGLKAGTIAPHSRLGVGALLTATPAALTHDGLLMLIGRGGYVGGVRVEGGQYDLAAALDVDFLKAKGSMAGAVNDLFIQGGFGELPEIREADWKGTPLLTRRPQVIAGERWFAVGDAAGYVEPFTGEGMAWAMNGALALAPIVQQAVGQWQAQAVAAWTDTHRRKIASRQWPCRVLSHGLRSPLWSWAMVTGARIVPGFAGPVLRHLSRPTPHLTGAIV